jgi:transcriptional regulator with XRE-family HTH domain
MEVHEKIKLMRQLKNWSQEEMASRLGMSISGYGSIERGETKINLQRLEEIASIFNISLLELINLNEKNVQNNIVNDNHVVHLSQISSTSLSLVELQHEIEKLKLMIQNKDDKISSLIEEISHLKEIIELMKKQVT